MTSYNLSTAFSSERTPDLLCLSHLRWNFVFQRPQHLMARFARERRVFYWEEPVYDAQAPKVEVAVCQSTGVRVATPHLPEGRRDNTPLLLRELLRDFAQQNAIEGPIAWFYTPMALEWMPDDLAPSLVIYDCMDELSMFHGAPPELKRNEARLFAQANLVFTGGVSLFEAKRSLHPSVHAFPSGVDADHFRLAREHRGDFAELNGLSKPRFGYAGVIDERIDLPLIEEIARRQPDWQIIMIGPTAKIDPKSLPKAPNISWLGMKSYADLPKYFAGLDVALMPFALNDSTRFISPTKTPEYLCAGLPVVSTPVRDVVTPYGTLGLVRIAGSSTEFVEQCRQALHPRTNAEKAQADDFLRGVSWDSVWQRMNALISQELTREEPRVQMAAAGRALNV